MNVVFNELTLHEFRDAIGYYNREVPGLGELFKAEIQKSIHRILDYPTSWPILKNDIRKYPLHIFPYKILYTIESDHLYIIAIAHQHRKPIYWIDRYLEAQ